MAESVTLRFNTSGARAVSRQFDRIEQKMEGIRRAGERMSQVGRGLTLGVSVPLATAATATVKLASDAQETENLFNSAMGSMREEANAFVEQWSEATDLDPVATQKRLATFQLMISNMGVASDRALQMSEDLTKLTVDLASLRNVSFEQAFTKLQSGLSGEMEALRRWGIIVGQARIEQVALREGIIEAGEEMTQQQKIVARYLAIMNQTNTEQGDFIETQDQLANSFRTLTDQIEVAARDIGEDLIPVAQDMVQVAKDLVQSFADMDAETRRTIITVGALAAAFGPLLTAAGGLTQFLAFAPGAFQTLMGVMSGLAGVISGPLLAALVGGGALIWAFSQLKEVHTGVTETSKSLREETKKLADELKGMGEEAIRSARMLTAVSLADISMQIRDLQQQRQEAFTREEGIGGRFGLGVQQPDTDFQKRIAQLREMQSALQERLVVLGERAFGGEGGAAGEAGESAGRQMAKGMHDGLIGALFGGEFDIVSVFERQAERARRAFVQSTGFQTIPSMSMGRRAGAATVGGGGVQQAARGLPASEMVNASEEAGASMQELVNVTLRGGEGMQRAAQTTISAFGAMAQAAVRGSDQMATSLINGITQIVQSIPGVGGIAGAAIGAAGGLLSAALGGGSDNRPQPVEVTNDSVPVEEQNPRRPMDVVIQAIDSADPAQMEHDLRRRTRRDATERIPQGTSLAGGS